MGNALLKGQGSVSHKALAAWEKGSCPAAAGTHLLPLHRVGCIAVSLYLASGSSSASQPCPPLLGEAMRAAGWKRAASAGERVPT